MAKTPIETSDSQPEKTGVSQESQASRDAHQKHADPVRSAKDTADTVETSTGNSQSLEKPEEQIENRNEGLKAQDVSSGCQKNKKKNRNKNKNKDKDKDKKNEMNDKNDNISSTANTQEKIENFPGTPETPAISAASETPQREIQEIGSSSAPQVEPRTTEDEKPILKPGIEAPAIQVPISEVTPVVETPDDQTGKDGKPAASEMRTKKAGTADSTTRKSEEQPTASPRSSSPIQQQQQQQQQPSVASIPEKKDTGKSRGWGSLLYQAVTNVEQKLDKVISDSSALNSEVTIGLPGKTKAVESRKQAGSSEIPSGSETATPGLKTKRLTMEERLAMAVKTGHDSSSRSSPQPITPRISRSSTPVGTQALQTEQAGTTEENKTGKASANSETLKGSSESAQPAEPLKSNNIAESVTVDLGSVNLGNDELAVPALGSPSDGTSASDSTVKKDSGGGNELLRSPTPQVPSRTSIESQTSTLALERYDSLILEDMTKEELIREFSGLKAAAVEAVQTARTEVSTLQENVDSLQKKLKILANQEAERASRTKNSSVGVDRKLAEKDEKIALLMEEGQRLSENELKLMTTIRKIKARAKEKEENSSWLDKKVQKLEKENEDLQDKIQSLKSTVKELNLKVKALTYFEQKYEALKTAHEELKVQFKDARVKEKDALLASLDETVRKAEATEEDLRSQLSEIQTALTEEKAAHAKDVSDLEYKLSQEIERAKAFREESNNEIKRLESKLEETRTASEEVTTISASETHNKYLRQIEVLQTQYNTASENFRTIEANLARKIADLEDELADTKAKEVETTKRFKQAHMELRNYRVENSSLQDQINFLKSEAESMKAENNRQKSELERLEITLKQTKELHTEEKQRLESQISKLEDEVKELLATAERQRKLSTGTTQILDMSSSQMGSSLPTSPYPYMDSAPQVPGSIGIRKTSSAGLSSPWNYPEFGRQRKSLASSLSRGSSGLLASADQTPNQSFDDDTHSIEAADSSSFQYGEKESETGNNSSIITVGGTGTGSAIKMLSKMTSEIRRLETQLLAAKEEVKLLTEQKEEAGKEMVRLMQENSTVASLKQRTVELEQQIEAMKKREDKTLEMLGEKSEQVEELKADVQDMKELYRQQIEDLVDQLTRQKSGK